jgi:TPR repeat protein
VTPTSRVISSPHVEPMIRSRSRLLALGLAAALLPVCLGAADIDALLRKARAGDAAAQFALGKAYADGDDVEKNPIEAQAWMQRAAKAGHAPAFLPLAEFLLSPESRAGGEYVAPEVQAEIVAWLRAAIAQPAVLKNQLPHARALLGLLTHQGWGGAGTREEGLAMITQARDEGSKDAARLLEALRRRGNFDNMMPRGAPDASQLRRAQEGDAAAQYSLSEDYRRGYIMDENAAQTSRRWLQQSAEDGHLPALYRLAMNYYSGEGGFAKDAERGLRLLERTASSGYGLAHARLGILQFSKNRAAAFARFQQALDTGLTPAQANAEGLQDIRGITAHHFWDKDPARYRQLAREAEAQNDLGARIALGRRMLEKTYEPASDAERLRLLGAIALRHQSLIAVLDPAVPEKLRTEAAALYGASLLYGRGVKADEATALEILAPAVAAGNIEAARVLYDYHRDRLRGAKPGPGDDSPTMIGGYRDIEDAAFESMTSYFLLSDAPAQAILLGELTRFAEPSTMLETIAGDRVRLSRRLEYGAALAQLHVYGMKEPVAMVEAWSKSAQQVLEPYSTFKEVVSKLVKKHHDFMLRHNRGAVQ